MMPQRWRLLLGACFVLFTKTTAMFYDKCPSEDPSLSVWTPEDDKSKDVIIGEGMKYLLTKSVILKSIYIQNGGVLVFHDGPGEIILSVEFIFLTEGGALHIGSEGCHYEGKATIVFRGKSFDKDYDIECGKKGVCVADGGILEIHGKPKTSWSFMTDHLWAGKDGNILQLEDDVSSWEVGDRVVVSSTDAEMTHAEEFSIVHCDSCKPNQVKIKGLVKHDHSGGFYKGIDMRAEVGLLTRDIVLRGEMEPHCYGRNKCQFFNFDTFGGHLMVLMGARSARLENFEVYHMGQQMFLARYPIHFHVLGDVADPNVYNHRVYAKSLSVHNCFSRCVTVHGTSSAEVKDVVGYDTLGHCFFLEDGNEQNNTFTHNLGLVTRPGTLLPTDRNAHMCQSILTDVHPGYMPDVDECTAVSTFWIAHPNNNFINNAAGGSAEAGFWFIFHEMPTQYGPGTLIPFASLRTPMGTFYNNKAHSSNYGLYIDDGVKTTVSSEYEPQEYLARIPAQYKPHKDRDLSKPRVTAKIEKFTAFMNNQGVQARGGDLLITDSKFSDNVAAIQLFSSESFPYDKGSHQEVRKCLLVGHRDATSNKKSDGVQFFQGPVVVKNCTFYEFYENDAAITFMEGVESKGHMSVFSYVSDLKFGEETTRFSIGRTPVTDGEKTRILLDKDGSLSGYPGSYIMNKDNWITRHEGCIQSKDCSCAICKGDYGSIFVRALVENFQQLKIWRNGAPDHPLQLEGTPVGERATLRTEYHPNIIKNKGYMMSWGWSLPHDLIFYPVNFEEDEYATIGICIKDLPDFNVFWELETHEGEIIETLKSYPAGSMEEIFNNRDQFYHDTESGILLIHIRAHYPRDEQFSYCSKRGCERWHFKYRGPTPTQDCMWQAYPKFSVKEVVGETVPMLMSPDYAYKTEHKDSHDHSSEHGDSSHDDDYSGNPYLKPS